MHTKPVALRENEETLLGAKRLERGIKEKSLILVTFHHTKTSDMLGVESGSRSSVENGARWQRQEKSYRQSLFISDNEGGKMGINVWKEDKHQ